MPDPDPNAAPPADESASTTGGGRLTRVKQQSPQEKPRLGAALVAPTHAALASSDAPRGNYRRQPLCAKGAHLATAHESGNEACLACWGFRVDALG